MTASSCAVSVPMGTATSLAEADPGIASADTMTIPTNAMYYMQVSFPVARSRSWHNFPVQKLFPAACRTTIFVAFGLISGVVRFATIAANSRFFWNDSTNLVFCRGSKPNGG
jgi:hypothetical protein